MRLPFCIDFFLISRNKLEILRPVFYRATWVLQEWWTFLVSFRSKIIISSHTGIMTAVCTPHLRNLIPLFRNNWRFQKPLPSGTLISSYKNIAYFWSLSCSELWTCKLEYLWISEYMDSSFYAHSIVHDVRVYSVSTIYLDYNRFWWIHSNWVFEWHGTA